MGKLRVLSGKEVCDILAKHGFLEVRRRGSHIVMQKKLSQGTITVPVPDHDEIRIAGHYNPSSDSRDCLGLNLSPKYWMPNNQIQQMQYNRTADLGR